MFNASKIPDAEREKEVNSLVQEAEKLSSWEVAGEWTIRGFLCFSTFSGEWKTSTLGYGFIVSSIIY